MPPTPAPRFAEPAVAMRTAFAAAFGDDAEDSLASLEATFRELEVDPFELFLLECVRSRERHLPESAEDYRLAVERWTEFMADAGRHPACPEVSHVRAFERELRDGATDRARESERTLRLLGRAYRFWQTEPTLPHGDEDDPFAEVLAACERR